MLRRSFLVTRPFGSTVLRNSTTLFRITSSTLTLRGYAEAAHDSKDSKEMLLTLAAPHETIFFNKKVERVNLSTSSGEMGLLADHVPLIAELQPGLIEVVYREEGSAQESVKKYFGSGGMVFFFADNRCSINCPEVVPVEDLEPEYIQAGLQLSLIHI
eukprot:TRINITY_DN1021_c0_g1_i3.p1 TRINITY_DN1021_c0_g1~~TRINITY_DN1021_c0_g1_i3.p1  ORF type:complete len:158 (-),score=14.63 TRINITY_DN1021_c0_g1_i3:30-503(-)